MYLQFAQKFQKCSCTFRVVSKGSSILLPAGNKGKHPIMSLKGVVPTACNFVLFIAQSMGDVAPSLSIYLHKPIGELPVTSAKVQFGHEFVGNSCRLDCV